MIDRIKDWLLVILAAVSAIGYFVFKRREEKFKVIYHATKMAKYEKKMTDLSKKRMKLEEEGNATARKYRAARARATELKIKYDKIKEIENDKTEVSKKD